MTFCPSQSWDAYCAATELPEECPVCKKPNFDEDTEEPVFAPDPAFCSAKCATDYEEQCRAEAEYEAKAAIDEAALGEVP